MAGSFHAIVGAGFFPSVKLLNMKRRPVQAMFIPSGLARLNRPRIAVEDIGNRPRPEFGVVNGLIRNEVQAPDLVRLLRLAPLPPVNDHFELGFPAQHDLGMSVTVTVARSLRRQSVSSVLAQEFYRNAMLKNGFVQACVPHELRQPRILI